MEDCIEIESYLLNKEDHSIPTSTTISSTVTKTTIEEFLEKDEQIEKDSTPNPMVNGLSNPHKLVMPPNSIINYSCFGRSNAKLSSFANSYKQSELLPRNQIAELNHINSWALYFDISRNEHGAYASCLLIRPCNKRTYSIIQLEPGYTNTVVEYETLIQGLRKAINMNVKYIEVFDGPQKVIKQVNNSMHYISNCMGNFQQEVWNLIIQFKVFKIKSIPHTFNTSIDMFKHIVKLENHFDLQDIIEKPWTYKNSNEDIKYLRRKKHRILLSPNPLVKIKLNKLLASRIIVSVHARKGRIVRLKNMKDQLNDDIWLY
jgi:ribonuclease HI